MQNIWLTKLGLGQVVFLNWFWDHYTSHPSNLHTTRNATRCINRDDWLQFSFTLKIYFEIYEDLWRSMMELNCENNKQKNSIVDARSGSSNVLLFLLQVFFIIRLLKSAKSYYFFQSTLFILIHQHPRPFNSFFFFELQYSFPWRRFCVIKFWSVRFSNSKFLLHSVHFTIVSRV